MKNLTLKTFLGLTFLLQSFLAGATGEVRYLDFKETAKPTSEVKWDDLTEKEDPYFKISHIKVTELEETVAVDGDKFEGAKDLGSFIMTVEKLIALGTKIWEIVKKGKPVVNMNFAKPVSVLPQSEDPNTAFTQMDNWSAPTRRRYRVEYTNLLGMNVISFDYTVYFQHSGRYQGKGEYVTGLTVRASNVAVSWGFEFNASSELETISNRGTLDDPRAAATILINYNASSVLRNITSSESFHVTGSGEIVKF